MKKVKLSSLGFNESNMLSWQEKKKVSGGLFDCPDTGQRCVCDDGSVVPPLDFCTHTCPRECPFHTYI